MKTIDKPSLHLVSGSSAGGGVKQALRKLGRAEPIIVIEDGLAIGPLHDVDRGAAARLRWWSTLFNHPVDAEMKRSLDARETWRRVARDHRDVVVWHGPIADERLFLLRVCWHLRTAALRLHEVRLGSLHTSRGVPIGGVGAHSPDKLANAWSTCARVRNVGARAKRWARLCGTKGAAVRELRGERIVTRALDRYDDEILAAVTRTWMTSMRLLGLLVAGRALNPFFFSWRLRRMIDEGELEGRGGKTEFALPGEVRRRGER